jgi:hypothetical protein
MLGRFLILLSVAAFMATAAVVAQQPLSSHTLTGTVTDASGRALPGVTVDLSRPAEANTVRTVTTDQNGRYRIDKVLPGVYVLTMRLPGFASAIRDIEIGDGGPVFEYDVQLMLNLQSASKPPAPPKPSRRVVCGMTLITPDNVDPGILGRRTPLPNAQQVKPTIRAVQPTMCWEPPDVAVGK